jgi:hypothetical protein
MTSGRHVRSFSFQETDDRALAAGRARLSRIIPGVSESETVRLALQVLERAPWDLVEKAARRIKRCRLGRPRSVVMRGLSEKLTAQEDEARRERFELLEEVYRLEEENDDKSMERLETLYARLGMISARDRS